MKKQSTKIERIIKKAVDHVVDTELYEWPPQCAAFLYHPTRPETKSKRSNFEKMGDNTDKALAKQR